MNILQNTAVSTDAGNERFRGDQRQIAGLLFGLSFCAVIFPQANLMGLIGPDGTTASEGIPLSSLVAGLCVVLIGISGMVTGYLSLVHDYGNTVLTGWVLVIVQTAWIPYITDMTNVGQLARSGSAFIPEAYDPSESDVAFVGAMGVLGIFAYGACFLGSLGFMAFSLYAYQVGKPGDRSGAYYRGRFGLYSGLVLIAGFAQMVLGAFSLDHYGSGPLSDGPVGVAMFTVTFPEISMLVGLVYILNGSFGVIRSFMRPSASDNTYQYFVFSQYVCTVVLMIMVQISYLPGPALAGAAPSRAALTLGAHVLPAFLDYKARTTPEELPVGYYGGVGDVMKEGPIEEVNADVEVGRKHKTTME